MQVVNRKLLLFITALLVIALTACGTKNSLEPSPSSSAAVKSEEPLTAFPSTFKHVLGETKLDRAPIRIFAPYAEDALLTLGVKPVLKWSLGDYVQDYLEPELKDVKAIDFTGGPNFEAILESAPDLIFLESQGMAAEGNYEKYTQIAPTYVFQDPSGDWQVMLRTLGDILDKKSEAEAAIKSYDTLLVDTKSKLASMGDKTFAVVRVKPKDFVLMDPIYYSGQTLFKDLGLTPHPMVKELTGEEITSISLEKLPELDADYIFYMIQGAASEANAKELLDSTFWKNLPAVKANHAYLVENNYWLAGGYMANTKQVEDVARLIGVK